MRVLIADDHDLLRDTLVAYLAGEEGVEAEQAASYDEVRTRVTEGPRFDLILLDFRMPGMKGLASLAEAMTLSGGGQRVALMSGEASRAVAEEALGMGAAGFIPKTLGAQSLVRAIKFMAMGEQYAPIDFLTADAPAPGHPLAETLTPRERDVLRGVVAGKSNKEIARDLAISEPTVKLHMKTLFRKLDVRNRTQAALLAREAQID
ncbi:two component transcriptional regulator, LuxR family [Roseivivax lentus]|uniref:Two component transcriptional regulator, LuxR family n=1 Tax=Roseivivax lentus TaxID=633194 RepID=A0A1N7N8C6_9RHOB|nr:response regulator transcription factor [Roseivivax lentus]SIS94582.1 two component transcriptional regulator, LuxR family [Roseivivax lentus]